MTLQMILLPLLGPKKSIDTFKVQIELQLGEQIAFVRDRNTNGQATS